MSGRIIELAAIGALVAGTVMAGTAGAQTHKAYRFNVGPKAGVSVNNPYGSVSVKPSTGSVVVINAVLSSDKVEVDNALVGNRVEIHSHLLPGSDAQSGRVDYEIFAPADASVTLHSSSGSLHAEKLHGDITMEGAAATVDVRDITNAHVHVKTLNGTVTLTNVQNGHVEVDSLSGNVVLRGVNGPLVQVVSTSGEINYVGDFGDRGDYRFTSYSGDIEAEVPDSTSADVQARSVRGEVHDDIPLQPKEHTSFIVKGGNAVWGSMGRVAISSTVALRSFSGKIHLRKRAAK
ncbi:MAG TPA: DUF4097 family beta strand repeat-containing protein [Candidatus Dormibacteraeota bacterium]|nr:DUF4097 family beta strand repeat-containing protein [Candidatus Dormibacteraeota bacterium]